jgi:hypothetical protein
LSVDPSRPSVLEGVLRGYKRRKMFICNMKMQSVSVSSSFRAATADGANTLLLIPKETKEQMSKEHPIEPPDIVGRHRPKRNRRKRNG